MNEIKYPIGRQDFMSLRKDGCLYVDKTEYIYHLVNDNKYVFLSRPRRFGKSLLLSTIESFFLGRRDCFKGLAIDKISGINWSEYPVIHLDFSAQNYNSAIVLQNALDSMLTRFEKSLNIKDISKEYSNRFENIIIELQRIKGLGVVVLIDEYDNPITSAIGNPELQEEFREILHGFYSTLKRMDRYIRFCMLTGVTKYGKLSIFSGMNNLRDISFMDEYAGICGITEDELHRDFYYGVEKLAKKSDKTVDCIYQQLKTNYDGYHFSEAMLDVYNPYSIINALANSKISNYWFETGTPTLLVKALKNLDIDIEAINGAEASMERLGNISSFDVNPLALFFQTGYLTLRDFDEEEDLFVLGFPNKEVESSFMKFLLPAYTGNYDSESFISDLRRSLRSGQPENFVKLLTSYLAEIPYDLRKNVSKYENYYHTIFYAIFSLIGVDVKAEYHTSQGSIDLVIKVKEYIYIIELKINGSAKDAVKQIEDKNYRLPFASDERRIITIGLGFSKQTNTIDSSLICD